jgi:hypothetical protein
MSSDPTEAIRRQMVAEINSQPGDRQRLEAEHGVGNVWDTSGLQHDFEVLAFLAPFCQVRRRADGVRGLVMFQHGPPRLYFRFEPA